MGAITIGGPATLVIWAAGELVDLAGVRLPGDLGLVGLVAAEGVYSELEIPNEQNTTQ